MFLSNGTVVPAQVDTLADQTPIFADASYYGRSSLPLLNVYAAYAAIYREQLWVGTVVRKLAMATARMPFDVKRRLNDTDSEPEAGALTELLARPNPRMSGFKLWEWTSSTRDIYGEAFWLKVRDNRGKVRELHPMHPTNVIVRRKPEGGIEYIYSAGTRNVSLLPPIPEEDVVAFTTYNPENLMRGLSTLESLRMTLLNEDATRRAMASMWAKGARPSVILTMDGKLSAPAANRLREQFDRSHSGADNAGSTAIFEEGLKPTIVQLNAEEMQYIEARKLNREEVCAAYDVPPPVVHILDHATFTNITEQLRSQYRDTMAPRFVNFESVIDHQLVPDFYSDRAVYTRFNMEEVLRGDFETKATAAVSMRNAGLLTGNQGLSLFGLPRSNDPEMDKFYANAALAPLGAAERIAAAKGTPAALPAAPALEPEVPEAEVAPPAKALTVRAVMGRLARLKTVDAITAALVDEHVRALTTYQDATDRAEVLHTLAQATARALGGRQYRYDDGIAEWLAADAAEAAKALDAVEGVFDPAEVAAARVSNIAARIAP